MISLDIINHLQIQPIMRKISFIKTLFFVSICGSLILSSYAFKPKEKLPYDIKLKILPRDISHDDIMAIMKDFKKSLGYSCGDCHAKSEKDPTKLDFSSFANPKKQVALDMMKMVQKINKKEFGITGKFEDNFLKNTYKVTCYTCHRGQEHPEVAIPNLEIDNK